jgi:F-type H+-transporting ATPase subunit b
MMMRSFLCGLSLFTICLLNLCAGSTLAMAELANFKGLNIVTAEAVTITNSVDPQTAPSAVVNEMSTSSAVEVIPAGDTHAEKNAEKPSGGLPQFNPASWPSQIFWLTIIFGTFYAVSSFWIVPKMTGIVTSRADYISSNLKQAEDLSNQAQHIKEEYETSLVSARAKASNEIKSVQDMAKQRLNQSIADFRDVFERDVAATETDITNAKNNAMADMNKIVATVASKAATKIAGVSADETQAQNVVKLLNDKRAKAA